MVNMVVHLHGKVKKILTQVDLLEGGYPIIHWIKPYLTLIIIRC